MPRAMPMPADASNNDFTEMTLLLLPSKKTTRLGFGKTFLIVPSFCLKHVSPLLSFMYKIHALCLYK